MTYNSTIKICWWNTGLTPPTIKAALQKRSLIDTVNKLNKMYKDGARLFGICEISESDLDSIEFQSFIESNGLKCASFYRKDGQIIWDMALIYDEKYYKPNEFSYVPGSTFSAHKKLAVKIDGELFGNPFRIYLSHFPATWSDDNDRSDMFKDLIANAKSTANYCPYTILMGDYNLELCSKELIESIARSRKYAFKSTKLYSPFLRHIGDKYHWSHEREISGTIKIKSKWEFYDFISITKHFLNSDSPFFFDDFHSGIWDDLFSVNELTIDHLPVFITISTKE